MRDTSAILPRAKAHIARTEPHLRLSEALEVYRNLLHALRSCGLIHIRLCIEAEGTRSLDTRACRSTETHR